MNAEWGYGLVKTLHIVFVTSWFAGLFYLPRIFVNLAAVDATTTPGEPARQPGRPDAERERLLGMARRLYRFMLPLAVLAVVFGFVLFLGYGIGLGPRSGWMHAKLALVLVLIGYHHGCGRLLAAFEKGANRHAERWYRLFNEAPVVLLLIVVGLVVIKPF